MNNSTKTAEGKLTPDDIATGSSIAAIMNRNPFMTANDVLQNAINASDGIPRKELTFEALHWGSAFEVPILIEACNRLGLGNPKTTFKKAFFSEHYPMAVSLDGMVSGGGKILKTDIDKGVVVYGDQIKLTGTGIIEGKLTSHEAEYDLPDYRGRLQLQMQMDITEAKWGAVAVLHRGIKLIIHVFPIDSEVVSAIRDASVDFDRRVQKYVDNQETEWYEFTTSQSAAKIFDQASDDMISLPNMEKDIETLSQIKQDISSLESEYDHIQARVMANMGDHKHLQAGAWSVVWPNINYKAVPEKVVPAKPARTIRASKLRIKHND